MTLPSGLGANLTPHFGRPACWRPPFGEAEGRMPPTPDPLCPMLNAG
jgi:hypothetical protein